MRIITTNTVDVYEMEIEDKDQQDLVALPEFDKSHKQVSSQNQ